MADGIFNIAKGRFIQLELDDPTKFIAVLFKSIEIDLLLVRRDDLNAIITIGSSVECDATNYTRKTITASSLVNDSASTYALDIPDQTWSSLGGAVNNTVVKMVVCYELGATDADRLPISYHDVSFTTDGTDVTVQIPTEGLAVARHV